MPYTPPGSEQETLSIVAIMSVSIRIDVDVLLASKFGILLAYKLTYLLVTSHNKQEIFFLYRSPEGEWEKISTFSVMIYYNCIKGRKVFKFLYFIIVCIFLSRKRNMSS